uniref:IVa2 protein n=1 Tax=Psittacine aviadenovirus B TaxID=2169709 RepID=A0AB38ZPB0_9ADEN
MAASSSMKRKAWTFDEQEYENGRDFYERVISWYRGANDLAPSIFPEHRFPHYKEFYGLGGDTRKYKDLQEDVAKQEEEDARYLDSGRLPSVNMGRQPVIGVIYGPTGSGKSHLLRAMLSCGMLQPIPETVIFVTPEKHMISPIEQTAWNLQLVEANYTCREDGTIAPRTCTFRPRFVEMTYDEATSSENLNIDHPDNVFVRAAQEGPVAVIMDECMDKLCSGSSIAVLFHALPSKLFARSAPCTAFYVLVVLHNMAPRTAIGNIPTLKVNAKLHIISCQVPQFQFSRFLLSFAHNISKDLMILLKAYFAYLQEKHRFSWVMYTPDPVSDSFRWCVIDNTNAVFPLSINIQERFLKAARLIIGFADSHKRQLAEPLPSITLDTPAASAPTPVFPSPPRRPA